MAAYSSHFRKRLDGQGLNSHCDTVSAFSIAQEAPRGSFCLLKVMVKAIFNVNCSEKSPDIEELQQNVFFVNETESKAVFYRR